MTLVGKTGDRNQLENPSPEYQVFVKNKLNVF
jgi:hypothetical protein